MQAGGLTISRFAQASFPACGLASKTQAQGVGQKSIVFERKCWDDKTKEKQYNECLVPNASLLFGMNYIRYAAAHSAVERRRLISINKTVQCTYLGQVERNEE